MKGCSLDSSSLRRLSRTMNQQFRRLQRMTHSKGFSLKTFRTLFFSKAQNQLNSRDQFFQKTFLPPEPNLGPSLDFHFDNREWIPSQIQCVLGFNNYWMIIIILITSPNFEVNHSGASSRPNWGLSRWWSLSSPHINRIQTWCSVSNYIVFVNKQHGRRANSRRENGHGDLWTRDLMRIFLCIVIKNLNWCYLHRKCVQEACVCVHVKASSSGFRVFTQSLAWQIRHSASAFSKCSLDGASLYKHKARERERERERERVLR